MRQPRAGESRTKLKSVFSRPLLSEIGINIRQEERDGHKKAQKSQNLFPRLLCFCAFLWLFLFTSNKENVMRVITLSFFIAAISVMTLLGQLPIPVPGQNNGAQGQRG